MLAKVLTTVLTAALALMVLRQLGQRAEQARARVRKDKASAAKPGVALVEDPETGVFRPVDRD